jgi:ABC-2 type transport system permease protein
MSTWMPWKIALKEMKVLSRKKSILYFIIMFPLFIFVAFSIYVHNNASGPVSDQLALGLDLITFVSVVLAAFLPGSIAAYSIVGEKVEKSLEPLLATPITDGEILLGKSIAAFVPPILAIWAGALVFMAVTDYSTHDSLSYYYFPNWTSGLMLLVLAPLAAIFSIEATVIASSRVSDVRGANQIASLMGLPFMLVFSAGATGAVTLNVETLSIFSGTLLIVDAALFYLSTSTFRREEILTKWK